MPNDLHTSRLRDVHSLNSSMPALTCASSSAASIHDQLDIQIHQLASSSKAVHLPRTKDSFPSQGKRSKGRLRVNSNNRVLPPGFPYANSSFLLENYLQHNLNRTSGSDQSSSSADVDLDLTMDHVPLEGQPAIYGDWWNRPSQEGPYPPYMAPVPRHPPSKCRSADSHSVEGWSCNRTNKLTVDEITSLHKKRTGSTKPLRILLDRAFGSPSSSYTPSFWSSARDSRAFTDATSPLTDSSRTPKTPNLSLNKGATQGELGQFGQLNRSTDTPPTTVSTGVNATFSSALTSQADRSTSPPTTAQSSGLHGLGFSDIDLPSRHLLHHAGPSRVATLDVPLRSPHSSCGSPSPGSPLLNGMSPTTPQTPVFAVDGTHSQVSFISRVFTKFSPSEPPQFSPRPRTRAPLVASMLDWPRDWFVDTSPAKLCFFFGLFMPVLFLLGAVFLRADGELKGTRAGICRCSPRKPPGDPNRLDCPADVHRVLRLLGAKSTGKGLMVDAKQDQVDPRVLMIDHSLPDRNGYVTLVRAMASVMSMAMLGGFAASVWAVVAFW